MSLCLCVGKFDSALYTYNYKARGSEINLNLLNILHVRTSNDKESVLSPFLFAIYLDDLAALSKPNCNLYIILYADDILLLAPTVTALENLLHDCECEIRNLDMQINFKKSSCVRIGPRHDVSCASVVSLSGQKIP